MKLWKGNRVSAEWELSNKEIAKRFMESKYNPHGTRGSDYPLVCFITAEDGLNSSWDWDKKKGSVEGSKDMLEILDMIDKEEKEENEK